MERKMEKILAAALLLWAGPAYAQLTPQTLQASISAVPWTNGSKQVTGAMLQQNFQLTHDLLQGMGTWDVNGNYTPPAPTPAQIIAGLGFTPLNKAGDTLLGDLLSTNTFQVRTNNTCNPLSGSQATDGTQAYVISCFGTWSGASPGAFSIAPTRGVNYSGGVPVANYMNTGFLVQSWADGNSVQNFNGMALNFQSIGGAVSAVPGAQDNAVGYFQSVRAAPSGSNQKPPATWANNWDFIEAPNAGSGPFFGVEGDLNNFNASCGVGSNCISVWNWFNGTSGYANLAMMYGGGASVTQYTGTATTSGNTLTVATSTGGGPFTADVVYAVVGGVRYRVSYASPTTVTSVVAFPTNATPVAFTAYNAQAHFAMFLNGDEQVLEDDIRLADAANVGIRLQGNHNEGFDTTLDTLTQAINLASGQNICFNSANECWRYGGGFLNYTVGATTVDFIDSSGGLHVVGGGGLYTTAGLSIGSATLVTTTTALANGAGSATATLTNGPTAGNPTKWIQINDNGTIRNIPAW